MTPVHLGYSGFLISMVFDSAFGWIVPWTMSLTVALFKFRLMSGEYGNTTC